MQFGEDDGAYGGGYSGQEADARWQEPPRQDGGRYDDMYGQDADVAREEPAPPAAGVAPRQPPQRRAEYYAVDDW